MDNGRVANKWGNCVSYWFTKKACRPRGKVCRSGLWIKTSAKKNSFHDWTKVKMVTVERTGRESGKTTLSKIIRLLQPSRRAASRSSPGNWSKEVFRRKIANGKLPAA